MVIKANAPVNAAIMVSQIVDWAVRKIGPGSMVLPPLKKGIRKVRKANTAASNSQILCTRCSMVYYLLISGYKVNLSINE